MTYRHLLVPTDGSARSRRAITMAVKLAAQGSQAMKTVAHSPVPVLVCR